VVGVQFIVDGVNVYAEDTTSPYSGTWNSVGVANGAHTITAVARDAAGNTSAASAVVVVSNQSQSTDTTPPAVSITSPASGATVSGGTVTLSSAASDNVGVVGVQFKIDGVNVGAEDTTSLYSVSWNSAGVSNGAHTVTAVGRDAAGNTATSAAVTINVSNITSSPPPSQDCAGGRVLQGTPSNYLSLVTSLKPCDTLVLAAGTYNANGLPVDSLNGTATQPITITGPTSGAAAVIVGLSDQNTVRIRNSSYVMIKNLEIDSRYLGVDPVNNERPSHHISLENLYIHGCSDDQGVVGISTNRAPAWNWIIRNNIITDCGTGMYLGNSDGNEQFLAGLIEHNLIYDTVGYNIEIKHQNPLPTDIPGLPLTTTKTVVRHNVFSKANNASTGDNARPNLLVGHVPLSGPGQENYYEIYGNFFYQNPSGEPLFQGEGNYAFYDNLLFNSVQPAGAYSCLLAQPHNDRPRNIRIFNNTIVCREGGISISGGYTAFQQKVIGNAVFAASPISAADQQGNITDTYQNAANHLNNPFAPLGSLDLFPKAGRLTGTVLDMSSVNGYSDWDLDFNGTQRTDFSFRGAYEGAATNPGWLPKLERMPSIDSTLPSDTTPPTIAIISPAPGVTVSGSVMLSATASDDVGVVGVQFIVDGVNVYAEDATVPYSGTWNTTAVSNGVHTVTAVARDAAGNTSAASVVVVVSNQSQSTDTTPPTVSITSPTPGATVSGGAVTLSATASDNVGVVGVQFKVDGVAAGSEDTTAPYSASWSGAAVTNGTHTLTAVARDAAGNVTTSLPVSFTVSNASSSRTTTVRPTDDWCGVVNTTIPGDEVVFTPGSYPDTCWISAAGSPSAPIVIRSQSEEPGQRAIFTYSGNAANVIELRDAAYLILRGFAFSSTQDGVDAIRIRRANDVIIERNRFQGIGGVSIVANDSSTQRITVRDNEFKDLKSTGLYFGCHDGVTCFATDIVVERNLIDGVTTPYNPSFIGYGIQFKLNSYGTIRANTIYRTKGPGVMVYGSTRNDPPSIIERNYIEGSATEGGIVIGGGPAIVRNNILVGNAYGGISAQNYKSWNLQQKIWIVHNTLLNNDNSGINVEGWASGSGNVIAYNAIVPKSDTPVFYPSSPAGTIVGNMTCTESCFIHATTPPYNLHPAIGSMLVDAAGGGSEPWRPVDDFYAQRRGGVADVGAVEQDPSTSTADTTPPSVVITDPTAGATLSGESALLAAKASDDSGVVAVQFQVDGVNIGREDTTNDYVAVWDTRAVSNGTHTLTAVARDAAGNSSTTSTVVTVMNQSTPVVTVVNQDTTSPTVSFISPANGATVSGSSVKISVAASDNVGVAGVQLKLDGVNLGPELTTAPYSITWDSRTAPDGRHRIRAIVRDAAGNRTSVSVRVTVKN
jgi:hypothetical protein